MGGWGGGRGSGGDGDVQICRIKSYSLHDTDLTQ